MSALFSPEVLACSRAVAATGVASRHTFPARPFDSWAWRELITSSQVERITPLLAAAIEAGAMPATAEQRAEAFDLHAQMMGICLKLEADLLRVVALLEAEEVEVLVLKGPSFARLDYDDPALRFFGDIDLLVRGGDWERSASALISAGYRRRFAEIRPGFDRRFGKGVSFDGPDLRQIDLHRTFVSGPFGLRVDLPGVWSATATFSVGGRPFAALDSDHRFIHACYHAAVGKREPLLVPLRDVAGMLLRSRDPIDIGRVVRTAEEWQGRAVIARAVVEATDRLALEETALSEWAKRYRPSRGERRALQTYLDPHMGFAARSFVGVGSVTGIVGKARYVGSLLFPSRTYGGGRHGGRSARWIDAARQIAGLGRHQPPG